MKKINIFISYSHADARWFDENSLIPMLVRSLQFEEAEVWYDNSRIKGGDRWFDEIEAAIERAHIAILLVSHNFLTSRFIRDEELPRIERRADKGGLVVIPILVGRCDWGSIPLLGKPQMIPGKPTPLVEYLDNPAQWDRAQYEIYEAVKTQINRVRRRLTPDSSPALTPQDIRQPESVPPKRRFPAALVSLAGLLIVGGICFFFILTRSGRESAFSGLPVWTEADSADNHYSPNGLMGDISALRLDQTSTELPFSGSTCTKISYSPEKQDSWAGIYWQYPNNNWGDQPGHDLSGATRLKFRARGEKGGEKAEFKVGGIRDGSKPYQDSCGPLSTGIITLTRGWNHYSIDLTGQDLNNVIGGFCWVTNRFQNPDGCTIYIDDIEYE